MYCIVLYCIVSLDWWIQRLGPLVSKQTQFSGFNSWARVFKWGTKREKQRKRNLSISAVTIRFTDSKTLVKPNKLQTGLFQCIICFNVATKKWSQNMLTTQRAIFWTTLESPTAVIDKVRSIVYLFEPGIWTNFSIQLNLPATCTQCILLAFLIDLIIKTINADESRSVMRPYNKAYILCRMQLTYTTVKYLRFAATLVGW